MTNSSYNVNSGYYGNPQSYTTQSFTISEPENAVKITLEKGAATPVFKTPDSVGADLSSISEVILKPNTPTLVDTGVSLALQKNTAGLVYIRSSLSLQGIILANGVGVIDPDYRGTVKVVLTNTTDKDIVVYAGSRVAQLILTPINKPRFIEVTELPNTVRGSGGFGSTGTN